MVFWFGLASFGRWKRYVCGRILFLFRILPHNLVCNDNDKFVLPLSFTYYSLLLLVEAPFIPQVNGPEDSSNFEPYDESTESSSIPLTDAQLELFADLE